MSKTEEPSRTPTQTDFASRSVGATPPPPIAIMTGEEEHRAKIRTLWTTRRAGTFCATPIETIHHPLPKKKKNVNSSSPAGMFNNLTTLQVHHTTPTLPVSPIPPKIKRFPPLFRAISPLLPSTWQNNIAREAGGRGKETDTPPLGTWPSSPTPLASGSVSVCQPLVFPPVRSRSLFGIAPEEVLGLAEALHGRPKRAKAKEGREVHAPPTDPRSRLSSDDW